MIQKQLKTKKIINNLLLSDIKTIKFNLLMQINLFNKGDADKLT